MLTRSIAGQMKHDLSIPFFGQLPAKSRAIKLTVGVILRLKRCSRRRLLPIATQHEVRRAQI